jgi:hypothetical protein
VQQTRDLLLLLFVITSQFMGSMYGSVLIACPEPAVSRCELGSGNEDGEERLL